MARRSLTEDLAVIAEIAVVPTILDVICRTTGMGFAAVARVTEDRWIACSVKDDIGFGLPVGGELDVRTTICDEVREHRGVVVFDDADADPRYRDHRTPKLYGLKSYVSMPIVLSDGTFFGTLCAIDPQPRRVDTPETRSLFKLFAELIAFHIDAIDSMARSNAALVDERETAVLREQFIAVLGHDLRNPLAGIQGGMRLLESEDLSPRGERVLGLVNDAVRRMGGLIDNVTDFARGRLGGGLNLDLAERDLAETLDQVVNELRAADLNRRIVRDYEGVGPLTADHGRIAQMVSNLLANALTHGTADQPISIGARIAGGALELSVANTGAPIPEDARERLFSPFVRGEVRPSLQGLGLGLYICAEIAKAHGGTITAASDERETRFTVRIPAR